MARSLLRRAPDLSEVEDGSGAKRKLPRRFFTGEDPMRSVQQPGRTAGLYPQSFPSVRSISSEPLNRPPGTDSSGPRKQRQYSISGASALGSCAHWFHLFLLFSTPPHLSTLSSKKR